MSTCGTFLRCACGHYASAHLHPEQSVRLDSPSSRCKEPGCTCERFVYLDEVAAEWKRYEAAMKGSD